MDGLGSIEKYYTKLFRKTDEDKIMVGWVEGVLAKFAKEVSIFSVSLFGISFSAITLLS